MAATPSPDIAAADRATPAGVPAPSAGSRWRPALVLVGLLALMLPPGLAAGRSTSTTTADEPGAVTLLAERVPPGNGLLALDPVTLEDRGQPLLAFTPDEEGWPRLLSADGSTLVTVVGDEFDAGPARTIVVRDGDTGAIRARYETTNAGDPVALSRDGTRLVVGDGSGRFRLLDTADGRLRGTTAIVEPYNVWTPNFAVDPDRGWLYLLVPEEPAMADGSLPPAGLSGLTPELIAYDLATGQERGRLPLPGLAAGVGWFADDSDPMAGGEEAVPEPGVVAWPALAVSPDGRRLVIVEADRARLRLIDTERLTTEVEVPFTRDLSPGDLLRRLVPLLPEDAGAKMMGEGPTRRAVFAPDGRTLYVWGFQTVQGEFNGDWAQIERGLGLVALDAATGRVLAEGLAGALVDAVLPTPDGRALYAAGPAGGEFVRAWVSGEPETTYALRRLDARTLAVEAERIDDVFTRVYLRPEERDGVMGSRRRLPH